MEQLLKATREATASLREKDPLAHRRRRRQRPAGMPAPHGGLKHALGELSESDLKKADQLWKMLDDMYESDPAEYQKFIEAQMKLGEAEAARQQVAQGDASEGRNDSTTSGAAGPAEDAPASSGAAFTPTPGIVVKVCERYSGQKYFINVCSHRGVQKPMGASGREVTADTDPALAKQIPLLVGHVRDMKDAAGRSARAVDVVFNPWVLQNIQHNNIFKAQVIDLALKWVGSDHKIAFETRWKTPKSRYKGGGGARGYDPLPFPLELVNKQAQPGNSSAPVAESARQGREKPSTKPKKAPQASALASPASLLRHIRDDSGGAGEQGGSNMVASATAVAPERKAPLIQAMDEDGSEVKSDSDGGKQARKTKKAKKKNKKQKSAVKKGFLLNSEHDALYPEGSNENGFVVGKPSGLLSKCNVVDTRSMSEAELKKTMEDYAAPGGNSRVQQPKQSQPKRPAKKQQPKKIKQVSHSAAPAQDDDPEFDDLMAAADPDALDDGLLNIQRPNSYDLVGGAGGSEDLRMIEKMLFPGGGMPPAPQANPTPAPAPTTAGEKIDGLSAALAGKLALDKPKYEITNHADHVEVTVLTPTAKRISQLELDISHAKLKLTAPSCAQLTVKFPCRVDPSKTAAKFKKTAHKLVVKVPHAS